jgi:hypothetical protein
MPAQNHIHKYYRPSVRWKGYKESPNKEITYHCAMPDCTHYMPIRLIIGKLSLCNQCEDEMVLNREMLRVRKPKCKKCRMVRIKVMGNEKPTDLKTERAVDETVDKLLKGI